MKVDLFADEFFDSPWDLYHRLLKDAPVLYAEDLDFYLISRYDDVRAACANWRVFSSAHGTIIDQLNTPDFATQSIPGAVFNYDPPDHSRLRRLVAPTFTHQAVAGLDDAIRHAVNKYLEPQRDRETFDFFKDFAQPLPAEVMFNLMGVPPADREHLVELFELFMHVEEGVDYDVAAAKRAAAVEELAAYFGELATWKLDHLGDDIVSHVIQSSYVDEEGNEQVLRDAELTGFLLFLTAGGVETTSRLLSSTLVTLQRHPVQWQKLRDDPTKIAAAFEEGGRFESPVQYLGRRCMSDTTIQGVTIPAAANVLLLIGAANRDPRAFSNPDEFDIERDLTTLVPLTFSFGPHICLGMHLARRQVQTAFGEILQRWPDLEVIEEGLVRTKDIHLMGWSSVPVSVSARESVG